MRLGQSAIATPIASYSPLNVQGSLILWFLLLGEVPDSQFSERKIAAMTRLSGFILIWAFLCLCYSTDPIHDDRLTQQRPSYGVNFDKVGELMDSVGTTFYEHTWVIYVPKLVPPALKPFPCETLIHWKSQCRAANRLIFATNALMYETYESARYRLKRALAMIPEEYNNSTKTNSGASDRKKRDTAYEPIIGTVPPWLKPSAMDKIYDANPINTVGQVFADIFHMPGPKAIRNVKGHLRDVGVAMYANRESLVTFNNRLSSVMLTMDSRAKSLQNQGTAVVERLDFVRENINRMHSSAGNFHNNITRRMDLIVQLMELLVTDMEPQLMRYQLAAARVRRLTDDWERGIMRLHEGYLPSTLIGEPLLEEVIRRVNTDVLTQAKYSDFALVSTAAAFYYKLKHVVYGRQNGVIHVTISMPMYRVSSRLPLYRVDVFSVPTAAGIPMKAGIDTGYTKLLDMPGFIAVSSDLQNYMEMNTAQYLSCNGGISQIKTCGYGISALRRRSSINSCAYSVFVDDHAAILKRCSARYSKTPPSGSAIQLTADNTFLMHAGPSGATHWSLSCPERRHSSIQQVAICNMCRIRIPCRCSLTGDNFFIPRRMSGCVEYNSKEDPVVSTLYHRNFIAMHTFVPKTLLKSLNSYTHRRDSLYPPFKLPAITFVQDNMTQYVAISEKYRVEFINAAALTKKKTKIYETKSGELLAKATDFTGKVTSRSTNLNAAVEHLVTGIFGGHIWAILGAIFAPMGLSFIAFCLSAVFFVPKFSRDIVRFGAYISRWKHRKKQEREMKALNREDVEEYKLGQDAEQHVCEECISRYVV